MLTFSRTPTYYVTQIKNCILWQNIFRSIGKMRSVGKSAMVMVRITFTEVSVNGGPILSVQRCFG